MRTAPDYIQFYPTIRCNRKCGFCFNNGVGRMGDMDYADFRRMIAVLRKAGVRGLDIMGGEPTLHAHLPEFLRHVSLTEMEVNLSSNGSAPHIVKEIIERCPRVTVGISLNDRAEAVGLEQFLVRHRPVVKTVAGRTVDGTLADYLLSLKPRRYYLLYRDAMGPGQLGGTVPFDRFLEMVRNRFPQNGVGTVFCSGFLPDHERSPELLKTRCPAGTTKLGILPDGSVYPCNLFFGFEEYRLGNILSDPFEKIWRHPLLGFFRAFGGNTCPRRSCALHASCHGGCPAHGVAHSGSRTAPDPRCLPDER